MVKPYVHEKTMHICSEQWWSNEMNKAWEKITEDFKELSWIKNYSKLATSLTQFKTNKNCWRDASISNSHTQYIKTKLNNNKKIRQQEI